jgi:FAD/FMN-containing dehydrogenase
VGGLVLDLAKLSFVHVDAERKLLKVGAGALRSNVDIVAAKHGLATISATCNYTVMHTCSMVAYYRAEI